MRKFLIRTLAAGLTGVLAVSSLSAAPLGSDFTYQGVLNDGGVVADGTYDLQFRLLDALVGGVQIGSTQTVNNIVVVDGLFTVDLDFGNSAFNKDARFLEVRVRDGASTGAYTVLGPRQPVTAAPVAIQSLKDANWDLSGGDLSSNNTGDVGIGTTNPIGKLHVADEFDPDVYFENTGDTSVFRRVSLNFRHDGGNGAEIEAYRDTGDADGMYLAFKTEDVGSSIAERMRIDTDGDVGVATTNPEAQFHVYDSTNGFDTLNILRLEGEKPSGTGAFHNALDFSASELNSYNLNSGGGSTLQFNRLSSGDVAMVRGGGRVGIGTINPGTAHLWIESSSITGFDDDQINFEDLIIEDAGLAWLGLYSDDVGNVGSGIVLAEYANDNDVKKWAMYARTTANVGDFVITYGEDDNPTANEKMLQVLRDGTTKVKVLEILGADVAERFPCSDDTVEAGDVLMIDADNPGQLCKSSGAYNSKVAGVVSGAGDIPVGAILGNMPGMEEAPAVALSGRVWVKCDASTNAIEVGDLITTAEKDGHAMKAADRNLAGGATIGKAMTALPQGETGLVLVLVNLQ